MKLKNPLRIIRVVLAVIMLVAVTVLFCDFSARMVTWLGWTAKIQLLPAVLALNFSVIAALVIVTLLLGRVYCSVICPLGIFQDVVSKIAGIGRKARFHYRRGLPWLRVVFLVAFIACFIAGAASLAAIIAPYSAYGRAVQAFIEPIVVWGNNLLASWAESSGSYAFAHVEMNGAAAGVKWVAAGLMLVVIALAIAGGRLYCNTICPVGSVLGLLSKFSFLKIRINESKCVSCGMCARSCKAECIDAKSHKIDYSRCVACYDCLGHCHVGALSYSGPQRGVEKEESREESPDSSRRAFLTTAGAIVAGAALAQVEKKVDGGLAVIEDKKVPTRAQKIVPPGAVSVKNLESRCTGCQLCVSKCPNQVLRTCTGLATFMQPESSYELGYCRPECTVCGDVCPAGAIKPFDAAEKTAIHIGHAVWVEDNCIVGRDEVECGNCARHCPVEAIMMVESEKYGGRKIPAVNEEKCIGCGACEYLCPARPLSAIYVEGHAVHRIS